MRLIVRLPIVLLLSLIAFGGWAQGDPLPFGGPEANTIRTWKRLNWRYVATSRTVVNYYGQNEQLARNTTKMAERAIDELQIALDFISESKYLLEVYPDPAAFRQAAYNPDRQPFESNNHTTGAVCWTGDYQSYYRIVKTRIAEMLIEDMFYGRGSRRSFQNRALMHLPKWYHGGLSSFMGEGWWPEDEARLRSFSKNPAIAVLNDSDSELSHTLRKSIWYFIFRRYGPTKLQELVYMTRLTRSADGGMVSVIGMDVSDFSRYWEDFVLNQIQDDRKQPDDINALPLTKRNERLVSARISPTGGSVAFVTAKNGQLDVKTYSPKSGVQSTGINWGYKTLNPALKYMETPIAWAPDGNLFAVALPNGDHWRLVYVNPKTGKKKFSKLPEDLMMIEGLAWSPDKKQLVFSAMSNGANDLYTIAPFAETPARLTRDMFDDLDPTWGNNSNYIYFSSNRGGNTTLASKSELGFYRNNFETYRFDTENRKIERLTNTPVANERYPEVIGDSMAVVQSDAIGLPNLHQLGAARPEPLTDLPYGYQPAGAAQKGVLMLYYAAGQRVAGYWANPPSEPLERVNMTRLGESRVASYSDLESRRAKAMADSMRKAEQAEAEQRMRKAQEQENGTESEVDMSDDRLRFYVFDEESSGSETEQERTKRKSRREQQLDAQKTTASTRMRTVDEVRIGGAGKVGPSLQFEGFDFRIGSHPLQDFYADASIQLADQHHYHHIRANYRQYDDFRSMDAAINYKFTQFRLNVGANFFTNRRVLEGNFIFKFQTLGGGLRASWPVNRYLRFEAGTQLIGVDRIELLASYGNPEEDYADFSRINQNDVRLVYNSLRRKERFIDRGFYANVNLTSNRNLTDNTALFTSVGADVRKYTKLGGITLLTRFNGGASFGPTDQLFMLGGVTNQMNYDFLNEQELPVFGDAAEYYLMRFATPLRMFDFNERSGNKYGVINAELRMPIMRLFTSNLQSKKLFEMQMILFYDIGTAWSQGNPFSQRNPVSVNTIERPPFTITVENLRSPFLQSFGAGMQGTIFGLTGRIDFGWGVDDGAVQDPRIIVTMGYGF